MSLKNLETKLGYTFKSLKFLELALIHKSSNNITNNERLEFLGDAVLNAIISQYLFLKFPEEKEGMLTRMRSHLVKGETLTKKANELDLISYIKLSKGTANLSEYRKHSILEGAVESIIGAVFLDSSWEQANLFILNLFDYEISEIRIDQEFRDSKTELQELLQGNKLKPPKYITTKSRDGFNSHMELDNKKFSASANSKRQAEISVAAQALKHIKLRNG